MVNSPSPQLFESFAKCIPDGVIRALKTALSSCFRAPDKRSSMIIVDNSDAESTHTLVPVEKVPRYLVGLTYASLSFSVLPFIFSLINVALSPLHSIPTIIAYVFTIPFHVATILVAWQNARQIDTTLPFEPASWRCISYNSFLLFLWIFSSVTCAIGSRKYINMRDCTSLANQGIWVDCLPKHFGRILATFAVSTALAAVEVLIVGAIVIVCFRSRSKKEVEPTPQRAPSPKMLSP